ncbi:MAG: glycosyltransferase family 4 protein [Candidatus Gastranaerophilales bacterium]|nr:glycosyltransferase family 4 protein [Candidatus Gastranaerophilales bacterium]
MEKTIIILTYQNLSDYKMPNAPTFWKTVESYYKDGWKIYIINSYSDSIFLENREKYVYTEFPLPYKNECSIRKVGWFFRVLRGIKLKRAYTKLATAFLEKEKVNLASCVIYSYEIWTVSAGAAVSKKYGIPFVTRFQGTAVYDKAVNVLNKVRYYPHFNALKTKSDMVIMTNDGTRGEETLKKVGNKSDKILFLRNGVDVAKHYDIHLDFEEKIGCDDKILMTLSRLANWKRIDRAILALAQIVKKYPQCKLVIVGYGEEKDNLENLACELEIIDHIIFTGEVAHDMVWSYINKADIFLSLYDMSNVGNPLMEAMRCGKPIITLDVGDTREVITNDVNGILLTTDEVDQIPDKVLELFQDPDYAKRLGDGAKKYAAENFWTWDERLKKELTEVNQLIDAYKEE